MSQKKADSILAVVAMIWGSSYLLAKLGLEGLGIFNLMALRFGIAFLITGIIFMKRLFHVDKRTLKYGALLGATLFLFFTLQYMGLKTTDASSAGFLISTAVVFIVILQTILTRTMPTLPVACGTGLTMLGITCLTLKGSFHMEPGSILCLSGAFAYGCHIILTSHLAKKADAVTLGILELGFCAAYGFIASIIFETPVLPATASGWIAVLGMGIGCSAIGFILQPMALRFTTAERAGILMALEPVCSAVYAFLFVHEVMSVQGYIGALFVLLGVFVSARKSEEHVKLHKHRRIPLSWLTNRM